jgi:hypothetical protein
VGFETRLLFREEAATPAGYGIWLGQTLTLARSVSLLDLHVIPINQGYCQTSWDAAERKGSRGIFVWESTDLVNWTNERLVNVEDATAGMVWAPEALWDPEKGRCCEERTLSMD